jgi:hypothetical protein
MDKYAACLLGKFWSLNWRVKQQPGNNPNLSEIAIGDEVRNLHQKCVAELLFSSFFYNISFHFIPNQPMQSVVLLLA